MLLGRAIGWDSAVTLGRETKTLKSASERHPSPSVQELCSGYCPNNGYAVVSLPSVCPPSGRVISTPTACNSGMCPEEEQTFGHEIAAQIRQ